MSTNTILSPDSPAVLAQTKQIQQQLHFLALREQGHLRPAARQLAELNLSDRSLRRLERQYKDEGFSALLDGRKLPKDQMPLLSPVIEEIILSLWYALPAAPNSLL